MRIGVTSQNFRTITGHAGKTRRFLVYATGPDGSLAECDRLDLPREMSLHAFRGEDHPLFDLDVVVTLGCGDGFRRRLATHGVAVVETSETDPRVAADAVVAGRPLPAPEPHTH